MTKNPKKIRLLLVDDEEEFLTASSRALSNRGFDVDVAPNGVTACDKVEKNNYDVVVLDVKMPDIDGTEVFRNIHEALPKLPVVILTGHGSIEDAFQTSKDGIADYLSKPIEMDELAEKLKDLVRQAKRRGEEEASESGKTEPVETVRVMLVDDETEFLESMRSVLRRRNMEVATADNGEEALALLKECLVDIMVLDVKMPGMDGLDVLKNVKTDFPSVEVILLSGHPSVEAALAGIKLGASEYMKKPPELDDLVATIRRLYQNRRDAILEQQKKLIEEIRERYPD